MKMVEAGYVAPGVVFVDGTHIKANANTKKVAKKEVPVTTKRYAEEDMEEANADREAHGKKPFQDPPPPPKRSHTGGLYGFCQAPSALGWSRFNVWSS